MRITRSAVLLFTLNIIDAVLTVYWVRNGLATEGNHLMAGLLDIGNTPFLAVKIAIGAVTSFVLYRWKDKPLARYGMTVALSVYVALMGIHFLTGLASWGYLSKHISDKFNELASFLVFFF